MKLSQAEIALIREADELHMLAKMPGWERIRLRMTEHVNEAAILLEGCQSNNEKVSLGLLKAWQERKKMLDAIDYYIASVSEARKNLLEELAVQHGIEPDSLDLIDAPFTTQ